MRAAAFHEYVHSLVSNRLARPPLWLTEGLAEYYSSLELTGVGGGAGVRVGKVLPHRAARLRTHAWLPLEAVLSAVYDAPPYTGREDRATFYAQSWALVHYLSADDARRAQLSAYLESLAGGLSPEESFARAFPHGAPQLERGLRAYVRAARFDARVRMLPPRSSFDAASRARPLAEAEVLSTQGDLLLRADRAAEAATYLRRALELDPNLAAAHAALGLMHLRANLPADARAHLLRALSSDPSDYLARYHFAQLLRVEATDEDSTVAGFAKRTRLLREELKGVVALAPDFLDAQALLARAELDALLADARADAEVRVEARAALDSIPAKEAAARRRGGPVVPAALQPCDMPEPGPQAKLLRFAGEQVCGRLVAVECDDAGVVLVVAAAGRTLKFRREALERIRFITYTKEVRGRIECGPRADTVLITYRPAPRDPTAAPSDGTVTAVEFLPDGENR
ncbi:MAG: tetratricopeptide repeat protein [Acidobacteria bacterium]|nr:tetratricopeptide repeat protein [Acidobacteriota bacterium]